MKPVELTLTPRLLRRGLVIATAVLLLLALAVFGYFTQVQSRERRSKQNLYAVLLALERYAVDDLHGNYPMDAADLLSQGYLDPLPANPYSGQQLRIVSLGIPPGIPTYLTSHSWQKAPPPGLPIPPGMRYGDIAYFRSAGPLAYGPDFYYLAVYGPAGLSTLTGTGAAFASQTGHGGGD
jgi:hypothetical protein